MSEDTPTSDSAGCAPLEALVERERALGQLVVDGLASGASAPLPLPEVDLSTLLGELIALRAEVRAETKEARTLREDLAARSEDLGRQLTEYRKRVADLQAERDNFVRRAELGAARALMDAVERLERLSETDTAEGARQHAGDLPARQRRGWRWLFGRRAIGDSASADASGGSGGGSGEAALASLREGVGVALKRLTLSLRELGVERIPTRGARFDASCMEAVGTESVAGVEPGVVLSEATGGWRADGRILQTAKVIVNKQRGAERST
jgi:molecular chaperone GrpE (heat shock protein)